MKKLLMIFVGAVSMLNACLCETVDPGNRGVLVTQGQVDPNPYPEGLHTFGPFSKMHEITVRQQQAQLDTKVFSSNMQPVEVQIVILYRIPDASVVSVFKDYHGDPFNTLIAKRALECIKESTATRSAEQIVQQIDKVKVETLASLRDKVGDILFIEDLMISEITLSKELTASIERKMVQEQEAEQAQFTKQKEEIDSQIAVIAARGRAESQLIQARAEAESIRIRGDALQDNPGVIQLQMIEKWNGVSPQIVSSASGSGIQLLLPAAK